MPVMRMMQIGAGLLARGGHIMRVWARLRAQRHCLAMLCVLQLAGVLLFRNVHGAPANQCGGSGKSCQLCDRHPNRHKCSLLLPGPGPVTLFLKVSECSAPSIRLTSADRCPGDNELSTTFGVQKRDL